MEKFEKINLEEFDKAANKLTEMGIKFRRKDVTLPTGIMGNFEQHQIIGDGWDFVCSTGTYGADEGLLEFMRDGEDPIGWLDADEVVNKIVAST